MGYGRFGEHEHQQPLVEERLGDEAYRLSPKVKELDLGRRDVAILERVADDGRNGMAVPLPGGKPVRKAVNGPTEPPDERWRLVPAPRL